MSGWTSPREKWIFTNDQALEFADQIHISCFPGLACSPTSMCSPSGTHGQCRQTGTGLQLEETKTLGVNLPIVVGWRSCLNPLSLFSLDCKSALKARKDYVTVLRKDHTERCILVVKCGMPPLWSLPWTFCPFFRCINCANETRQWKNNRVYTKSILFLVTWNHFALSSISRPNTWICSLYLGFSHLVNIYYHRSTSVEFRHLQGLGPSDQWGGRAS